MSCAEEGGKGGREMRNTVEEMRDGQLIEERWRRGGKQRKRKVND